jgi:signal transduction histidine kinase
MTLAPVFLPEVLEAPGKGHAGYLTKPTAGIASAAVGLGRTASIPDVDGIVRRAYLFVEYQGRLLPELMVAVAGQTQERLRGYASHSRGSAIAPAIGRFDEFLIPFSEPAGNFQQVSASDVVDRKVSPDDFKGKYVLIGATAPGLLDNYPTPVSGSDGMPNIEIGANILNALLHHQLIRQAPMAANLATSMALVWMLFFSLVRFRPNQTVWIGPIGSLLTLAGSVVILLAFGLWLPPTPVLITRTLVQVIWSSRRLQAASDYFAKELSDLQIRSGGALVSSLESRDLRLGDSVARQMMLIDDTKRRMRELRRFVTDVLATFPDPVLVVNTDGVIITVNEAGAHLGGKLSLETAPGARVQPILEALESAAGGKDKLWPPALAAAGANAPRGLAPGGRVLEARYTANGRDGDMFRGWTVHLVDVTALVSAMRQREEAMQLFTHDMRSPQSAILAALEHKDFKAVPEALREGIERNAQRTISLADGFVRLAQAEAAEYAFEPVDLFHLVTDAADAVWAIGEAAGVRILVEDPGREYVVNADRSLLVRALINLLDNAIKFSPPGKDVVCALEPDRLHGRPAVACTITDQASGMSRVQQKSLFKRFARAPVTGGDDEGRPVRSNSIGLGLAVVHTVVTRHDGVVDCHSELGEGTVFTICLPLFDEPPETPVDRLDAPVVI